MVMRRTTCVFDCYAVPLMRRSVFDGLLPVLSFMVCYPCLCADLLPMQNMCNSQPSQHAPCCVLLIDLARKANHDVSLQLN
jgi:hypothetical protein